MQTANIVLDAQLARMLAGFIAQGQAGASVISDGAKERVLCVQLYASEAAKVETLAQAVSYHTRGDTLAAAAIMALCGGGENEVFASELEKLVEIAADYYTAGDVEVTHDTNGNRAECEKMAEWEAALRAATEALIAKAKNWQNE